MKKTRGSGKSVKTQSTPAVRASISFPPSLYETIEEIAKQKKVSLAWVVRDAMEMYVAGATAEGDEEKRRTIHAAGKLTQRTTR